MKLYGEGIAKLTEDKAAMDEAIVKARKTIENIEDDCKSTAQNVLVEIKTAYDNYVADVEQGWDAHFEAHPVHLSIPDLVKAMMSRNESVKQEKMKPIQEAIKQYVDSKSAGLNQSIGDILQTNVTSLEQRLALYQEQLEALQCPVDINEILAKIYAVSSKTGGANPNIKVNTFQLILGLAGGDLDIAMGAFTDSQSNKEAVIKSITKNVFEYIALNVIAWPIGLAMLVVRGYNIIKSLKDGGNMGAKNILNKMKPGTIDGLRSGKKNLMMDLEKQLGGAFIRAGTTFSASLNNELTTYQKSFEEMVENLSNENFNIEKENERTQKLLGEMARIINNVCRLTMNKELSIYEIKAFAEKAPTAE